MMFARLRKFLRREKGVAAVELALVMPIFMLMFLSATEIGNMIYYSTTIEKGMRSAITYAARTPDVLSNAVISDEDLVIIENIARTGSLTGGTSLVAGYDDPESKVTITTHEFTQAMTGQVADITVTVVTVSVEVPYVPLMDFVTQSYFGEFAPTIHLTHEQAMVGD